MLFLRLNNSLRASHTTSNAKRENGADSDSDDFVVKENKFQEDEANNTLNRREENRRRFAGDDGEADDGEDAQHGALVKKILESKEQLEFGNDPNRNREVTINRHINKNSNYS